MKENAFQAKLIKEISTRFPGCVILKNDANYIQGFPDLTILYGKKWAVLETKRKKTASRRPNQNFYVDKLNRMSYASYIYPENKEDVLNDLQESFRSER